MLKLGSEDLTLWKVAPFPLFPNSINPVLYFLREESAGPKPEVRHLWSVRIRGWICNVCRVFLHGTVVHKTQLLSDSYWPCSMQTLCLWGPVILSPKAPLSPDCTLSTVVVAHWHQAVINIVNLILPRIRIKDTKKRIVRILASNGMRIHFKWLRSCIFNFETVKRIFPGLKSFGESIKKYDQNQPLFSLLHPVCYALF